MSRSEISQNEPTRADGSKQIKRDLPPAAQRALAEAEARRAERDAAERATPNEIGGQQGPDPARYGDWEKDGVVSDF